MTVTDVVTEHHVYAAGERILTARRLSLDPDAPWTVQVIHEDLSTMLAGSVDVYAFLGLGGSFATEADAVRRATGVAVCFEPLLIARTEAWKAAEQALTELARNLEQTEFDP